MIFIGPKLSEPTAHFVTNIIASIGGANDLIVDLKLLSDKESIFEIISAHLKVHDESYVIYNAYENEDFFLSFKKNFPALKIIGFFSDDEWRHMNYDRYVALYMDYFTLAVRNNIKKYVNYGLNNHFYMQWACNPDVFYPVSEEKKYDVTFVGAPYGRRIEYIRYLIHKGIDVKVFGKGWGEINDLKNYWGGFLTDHELLKVIGQSRINLNFLWTSREPDQTTIKGRTMELAACRGFQLSNSTDEYSNYGFENGVNIATFNDKKEMLSQVRYFLENEGLRETIAQASYDFVVENHTWVKRFKKLFSVVEKGGVPNSIFKPKILVVLQREVQHSLIKEDPRFSLEFKKQPDCSTDDFTSYTGVVFLTRNSTINNDSLFMMALAQKFDDSNIVLANYYVANKNDKIWIRFNDVNLKVSAIAKHIFPDECFYFSPDHAKYYLVNGRVQWEGASISFVEYPSFSIYGLNSITRRTLRLFFGEYSKRKTLRKFIQDRKYICAIDVALDYMIQRKTQ